MIVRFSLCIAIALDCHFLEIPGVEMYIIMDSEGTENDPGKACIQMDF